MVTILEHCLVSPPPGSVAEKSVPLTFFDLLYLHFFSIQHMFFYEFTHSTDHFMKNVVPSLKHSLSLTLKHFYPLAGNLIFPSDSSPPQICYRDGDSVPLIFAESSGDFNHLVGNHARNASEFQPLLPQLPPGNTSHGKLLYPLSAIQLTLFPNAGICMAFHIAHVVGDGATASAFGRSWALISATGDDRALLQGGLLPSHDRTLLKDNRGVELETIFWEQVKKTKFLGPARPQIPTNKIRVTFVMSRKSVEHLKKQVRTRFPSLSYVSIFSVTSGYVWSCMVQSLKTNVENGKGTKGKDEEEHFRFLANCRAMLNPPLPALYFGTCAVPCVARAKASQLMAEDGFAVAAKCIGEAILRRLHNEDGLLKGAENWMAELEALKGKRVFGTSSSPKFNHYDIDFGWGKPKKIEMKAIDDSGTASLTDCRSVEGGGIEVGLSFPMKVVETFASVFAHGLDKIAANSASRGIKIHASRM